MKALLKDFVTTLIQYFIPFFILFWIFILIITFQCFRMSLSEDIIESALILMVPLFGISFVLLYMKFKKIDISFIKKRKVDKSLFDDIVATLGINIGFSWIVYLFISLFMEIQGNIDIEQVQNNFLFSLIVQGILIPIDEELFFRGFLPKKLENHKRISLMIVISLFFGIAHFNLYVSISTLFMSFCMLILLYKHHSIYPCIFIHIFNNSLNLLAGYLDSNDINLAFIIMGLFILYGIIYLLRKRNTIFSEIQDLIFKNSTIS